MQDILHFVDQAYCINLDSRPDRWQDVSREFTELGIKEDVQRVSAVVNDDPRIGCLKSHRKCAEEAIRNRYENILIFEDDVSFYSYDNSIWDGIFELLRKNDKWDLFYLGGMVMSPARFIDNHVFRARFFSTHAYIMNKRAFGKVQGATAPIDIWYAWNMVSYGICPMFATQTETYSDIRKKLIANRQNTFTKRYDLLVKPNIVIRWKNYIHMHYLKPYLSRAR